MSGSGGTGYGSAPINFGDSVDISGSIYCSGVFFDHNDQLHKTLTWNGTDHRPGTPAGDNTSVTTIARFGGTIYDHFADGSSTHTDGTEDDLYTDTTPASMFAVNGDKIEARYVVNTVAHATATRKVKVYFAGTAIYDSTAAATAVADTLDLHVTLIRESSTVVRCIVSEVQSGTIGFTSGKYTRLTGLTLSGTNILKVTGAAAATGAAASDIVAVLGSVKWFPAAA